MLTDKEVEHITKLTRIKLTDKEKEKFKNELSSIFDYVKKLNELDTEGIDPIYQVTGLVNALRQDENRNDFEMSPELNEKLIGQAPQSENGFIKVKSVFQK